MTLADSLNVTTLAPVANEILVDVLLEVLESDANLENVLSDSKRFSTEQRESILRLVNNKSHLALQRRETPSIGNLETPLRKESSHRSTKSVAGDIEVDDAFLQEYSQQFPTGAARYTDGNELGRGGWGIVVRAHDQQLGRDVAVKKLTNQANPNLDVMRRFLHEAEITGQLQHPGIVPVYERGISLDDGQPFYAMKLLDGTTLSAHIKQYHDCENGLEKRARFHKLLGRFVDVCQAVCYAHQHSIIHRDLKPSNVVVGEFGETVVVDWGLAKKLDQQETPALDDSDHTIAAGTPLPQDAGNSSSKLSGLLDPVATYHGSVIGTPAYMPPEQASGKTDLIDPKSDTYSLGVILYEILTGKTPFRGDDAQTTIQQVLEGNYEHPRAIDKSVPTALASICTKAITRSRDDRYASAIDLADEVTNYLAGEKVLAHQETVIDRTSRWCRRRPTFATSIIAATLLVAIITSVASIMIATARHNEMLAKEAAITAKQEEAIARNAAEDAKRQALQRLEESRKSADSWLVGLSGTLQSYPGMQPVREELHNKAIEHYQAIIDSTNDQIELLVENARCLIRLGDLMLLIGKIDSAKESFRKARSKLEAVKNKTDFSRHETVNVQIGLLLCDIEGKKANSADIDALSKELKQLQNPTCKLAEDSERLNIVARGMLVCGRAYEMNEAIADAQRSFEESLTVSQRLVHDFPRPKYEQLLSTARTDLASLLSRSKHHGEAARLMQDEVDAIGARLDHSSRRPDLLEARAIANMRWAGHQRTLGEDWAAEQAYRSSVDDLSSAWKLMFGDHYFSENLAIAQANLGQLALQLGQLEDAENMLRAAETQLTGLSQSHQADGETVSRLASCTASLGHVLAIRNSQNAQQQLQRAIDIYAFLETNSPSTDIVVGHARSIANIARWHANREDYKLAAENHGLAIKKLASINNDAARKSMALAKLDLAEALSAVEDTARAESTHKEGVSILAELSKKESIEQKARQNSSTVSLLKALLECEPSLRDLLRAGEIAKSVGSASSNNQAIDQLKAILALHREEFDTADALMRKVISRRRASQSVDQAILGCVATGKGELKKAEACLSLAKLGQAERPGDSRLANWISQLEDLLRLASVNADG